MKLGISTACFYGDKEVEEAVQIFDEYGIGTCEIFLNCESEYTPEFIQQLKIAKGGMKVHSIHPHGTSFEPELFSIHGRTRADAEATFKKVCNAGYVLGAKYITFHGPFVKVGRPIEVDYIEFGNRVNQLCEIAASYGLQIAYENVNWAFGSKPEFFTKLFAQCPDLKATLDIKQAIFSGFDPLRFVDAMEDRLVTVHICDMDRMEHPMLPFKGKYNFDRLFKDLKHRNLDPVVLIEVYRNNFNADEELFGCYERMKNLIATV